MPITKVFDGKYFQANIIDESPEVTFQEPYKKIHFFTRSESIDMAEELIVANQQITKALAIINEEEREFEVQIYELCFSTIRVIAKNKKEAIEEAEKGEGEWIDTNEYESDAPLYGDKGIKSVEEVD